jgi:predicted nuclease with TOPRIM domain
MTTLPPSMETFDLCDVENGLKRSMSDVGMARTLGHIRTARVCRLIESNSAETKRLMHECEHLSGEEWMARQDRITELFKEHARLCEVWDKAGPT